MHTTISSLKSVTLMNELMELIFMNRSSLGYSNTQAERLKLLYSCLNARGKEHIELWAENNDLTIPKFLRKA